MATQVTVLWTAPGISLQMHLLTFPLFLAAAMATEQTGRMDGVGLWPLCLLQAMEPILLALLFRHPVLHKKSFINCLFSLQLMSCTF